MNFQIVKVNYNFENMIIMVTRLFLIILIKEKQQKKIDILDVLRFRNKFFHYKQF